MKNFRWTPNLNSNEESSIVPLWMCIPESSIVHVWRSIPLFLFDKQCLFSIDSLVGVPLTIDMATAEISRLSMAKICVQVNLLKKLPSGVWLD